MPRLNPMTSHAGRGFRCRFAGSVRPRIEMGRAPSLGPTERARNAQLRASAQPRRAPSATGKTVVAHYLSRALAMLVSLALSGLQTTDAADALLLDLPLAC